MPLLLRTVRENRWLKSEAAEWLRDGDVPADPLGDLPTQGNCLSVWRVHDDHSNVERIVRAVASGKQRLDSAGYVIFDEDLVRAAEIVTDDNKKGASLDQVANEWHCDLTGLSGKKLVALTRAILETGETGTILKKRLKELVEKGIRDKELPEKLRDKLG